MKLKGSTLIETLTAISLLSLIFLMGMSVFERMSGQSSPAQKLRTRALVSEFLHKPVPVPLVREEETERGGRRLVRRFEVLDRLEKTLLIEVDCYYGETRLGTRSKIVFLDQFPVQVNAIPFSANMP